MKSCPFCAEQIQDQAIKCRYCGSMLGAAPAQAVGVSDSVLDAEVRSLMNDREKINAIKLVRERTGLGLAEAKQYVEAVERGLDPRTAVRVASASTPAPSVRVGAAIIAAILAALAILFLLRR